MDFLRVAQVVVAAACFVLAGGDEVRKPKIRLSAKSVETKIWTCNGSTVRDNFEESDILVCVQLNGTLSMSTFSADRWLAKVCADPPRRRVETNISENVTFFNTTPGLNYAIRGRASYNHPADSYLQLWWLGRRRCSSISGQVSDVGATLLDNLEYKCTFAGNFGKPIDNPVLVTDTVKNYTTVTCRAGDHDACPGETESKSDTPTDFFEISIWRKEQNFEEVCKINLSTPLGKHFSTDGSVVFEGRVTSSGAFVECHVPTLADCGEQFKCKVLTNWPKSAWIENTLNHTFDKLHYCKTPENPGGPAKLTSEKVELWQTAVIVVVVVVVVVLAALAVVLVWRHRRQRDRESCSDPNVSREQQARLQESDAVHNDEEDQADDNDVTV